jgi:peptide/nickel transport system substrate-binding protein
MERRAEPIYGQTTSANKTWYSDRDVTFPYDPEAAGKLLTEMGLVDRNGDGIREDAAGHEVEFTLNTNVENNLRVKIIDMIKEDMKNVGVKVTTRPIDFNTLVRELQDGHKWESIVLGWGSGVPPDPLNGKNIHSSSGRLHVWYPQQAEPATEWEARIDELLLKMDQLPDEEKRIPLWHECSQLFAEQQPIVYLFAAKTYACVSKRVQNARPSILRPSTWWNLPELYVVDQK